MNETSQSTKNEKVGLIERFFAAYAAHDREGIGAVLAHDIRWTIPGRHPLSGTKRGIAEVLAFFDALAIAGFKAEPLFLEANDHYVVDIHRGWSTGLEGKVDTLWALIWHFDQDGKIDEVSNLCGDQAQMDAFCWTNFALKPLPDRLEAAGESAKGPTKPVLSA